MGKNLWRNLCQGWLNAFQQRYCKDGAAEEVALPGMLPKNGNGVPWKGTLYGQRNGKHLGRLSLAQRTPGNPEHIPFWGSCYCQPHFGTFLWSYAPLVQASISFTAVTFVCFLTAAFGVLCNMSCTTFLTQIHFGAFDWKRSCRSSSTPKWQIMPTHHQYIKQEDISLVTMHS